MSRPARRLLWTRFGDATRAHEAFRPPCRGTRETLRELALLLAEDATEPPPGLATRIMAVIRAEP